ncbi:MAG: methyltransferase domain-containing protein [Candidatus Omnitrophota bacterium]|jgi:2-polyprenyl-3-methyl-5-hydroxy-6-metoxy-1,4-benzoquinol methylase
MQKQIKCNLCGSNKYSVVYKTYSGDISTLDEISYTITDNKRGTPLRLVKCAKCGLIYANPRPSMASLLANYSKMVDPLYLEEDKGRRISAQAILHELKRLKKSGKLLDVGCGTGFLLDEAKSAGWDVYGVDLSKWAIEYAHKELGIENVLQGTLKNADYPPNNFDVVILKDAIEHLTDPKETLVEIRRILKSDGILCVNTPDIGSFLSRVLRAKWWGVKQSHLYYFTRKSLANMLNEAGFVPVKVKTHARTFSLKYWAQKAKDYNKAIYKICSYLMKRKIVKNGLVKIDLGDQVEVYARKMRKLKYLKELEVTPKISEHKKLKVVAVLPAYNAAGTLKKTVADIPRSIVDDIILVDDRSSDDTVHVAKELGIKVLVHKHNRGYGGNQKTCYKKALEEGAGIVVMVHPDYQYDPKAIPEMVEPIMEGRADAVFGSRMMKGGALEGGMPLWKHNVNIMLTALENVVFGVYLTEYHSGFRAYSAKALESIKFELNSDGFIFDTEIITQILLHRLKIEEVPIRTRYFDEASTIKLWPSILYGLGILKTLGKYILHTQTFIKFKQFE